MSERDNICSGCFGRVKIPARSRSFTIDEIMEHHKVSCPARGIQRNTKKEDHEQPT